MGGWWSGVWFGGGDWVDCVRFSSIDTELRVEVEGS